MNHTWRHAWASAVLGFGVCTLGVGAQSKIYWLDAADEKIQRANLDGTHIEDIVFNINESPYCLALDLSADKMYWTDRGEQKIRRANLDGSEVEDLVTRSAMVVPAGIALDPEGGKMYWADRSRPRKRIQRANLDGSDVEDVIVSPWGRPFGVALDTRAGKVYWTDSMRSTVSRANLDGSHREVIVSDYHLNPYGIALDLQGGKVYWGGYDSSAGVFTRYIRRANLDGSNVENVVRGEQTSPCAIALDLDEGKVYWTTRWAVRRANLDGSAVEDFVAKEHEDYTCGVAVDDVTRKIYWTEDRSIHRSERDGTGIETLIEGIVYDVLFAPQGMAVDSSTRKMYWTDINDRRHSVMRADADGANADIETVIPDAAMPGRIVVDSQGDKMYWADISAPGMSGVVRRSKLDGSEVETIIQLQPTSTIGALALDLEQRKLYSVQGYCGANELRGTWRTNLDGTGAERVEIEGLGMPSSLAVDSIRQKIYWPDHCSCSIRRADVSGANTEEVVSLEPQVRVTGIALHPKRGQMFWIERDEDAAIEKIRRASLEGTGIEDIVIRFPGATALTIDLRELLTAGLDIRPGSCPNPLNVRSRGVVPMALVGTESFDVSDIDPESIALRRADGIGASVYPLRWRSGRIAVVEDLATPFDGDPCDCHDLDGNGTEDLFFRFSTREMVRAFELNSALHGDEIELIVSGRLFDGREFTASDCITIVGRPGSAGLRGTRRRK